MHSPDDQAYGHAMHSMSSATSRISAFEPRVVERSRGTAHPNVPTTRPVLGARRGDALLDRR